MLHVGLDLSRRRLDVCVLSDEGELVEELAAPPDPEGLRYLVSRLARHGELVRAVIESMTGAGFIHDTLEQLGWDVLIADAQRVKGLAPLACKTDRVDSRVLAVLWHRNLVPAIWLPDPRVRAEREQARFRLHLVKHKSMLKHRIHATLMTFGHPCPVTDVFGLEGRQLLERLELPQPWRETLDASLYLIDYLESEIDAIERDLRATGADHPYVPLLLTVPGIGGCWRSRSPQRSATSAGSRRPASSSGTPACAPESASPATQTAAGRCPSKAPDTCAGRCSKRPCTRSGIPPTGSATSAPNSAWANSAAPKSPRSSSPASSPRRSGTCSPPTSLSTPPLREAPRFV
jgi:transposase